MICGNKACTARVGSVRVTDLEAELVRAVREASALLDGYLERAFVAAS